MVIAGCHWSGALRETPKTYLGSGAIPNKRSVLRSRSPWKYLSSSRWNTDPAGDTHANKVAQDFSFFSSVEPKISFAEWPSTLAAASAHSRSLGPRTG